MKTNRSKNLAAAGTYLTTAVTHLDAAHEVCNNRAHAQNDVLFEELRNAIGALTRYLVNLQLALELNEAAEYSNYDVEEPT